LIEPFLEIKNNSPQPTPTAPKENTSAKTNSFTQKQGNIPQKANKLSGISNLGISISAFSQEKNKKLDEGNENSIIKESLTESFTPLELLNKWKSYSESLVEEHHLKNTMMYCLPDLMNRDTFEVVVNNPVQEQRLKDNASNILSFLRKELKNTSIQMNVRVTIDNEKKLGFTSLEKFNLMIEQNDSLKKLKDEFGLELL